MINADEIKQQILAAEDKRFLALLSNNIAFLDEVLDEDLRYVHANGLSENKKIFLDRLRSGERRYVKFLPRDRTVKILGDIAFVFGDAELGVQRSDKLISNDIRYVAVYLANAPHKLIVWQSTKIS